VARRPLDRSHRRLNRSRVQVRQLGASDLFDLLASDPPYLIAIRSSRAFFDSGGFLEKVGGGRCLGYEREGAVRVDRYHDRYSHIHDVCGFGVERLAKLHDVYAVLTKRRANW